ncbi:MAG: HD domain-containing protein [Opitutae bacterium]|jgi:tRNA nucleotidyltransferase (CCA-adding enzyme)|nr:HD domain-containing protein [Opitutae bacterium]
MDPSKDLRGKLPENFASLAHELATLISSKGGRLLLVGGSVRDLLLEEVPHELDVEARGLETDQITSLIAPKFRTEEVGKSFGVLKVKGLPIEISLPRTERKTGTGHKGFSVEIDPHLPFEEASARRDFTINALGLDPLSGELLDPYNGQKDLDEGILRHVGPAFSEDPLRVLRGMQFIARFNLQPAEETVQLCRNIPIEHLPPERLFEEWKKLIVKGKTPSLGLHFLKDVNWLRHFPELESLVDCEQDPEWHPEGDVWVHTLHCMDAFARERIGDEWEDLVVGLAVLCHDLGKPLTSYKSEDGRIRSPKHEPKGEDPTRSFLGRLTNQVDLTEQVVPLVRRHLAPRVLYKDKASDGAIRRLARQVKRIDRLVRVAKADLEGRPPRQDEFPEGPWLLERAEELKVKDSEPKPIVQGRHLVDRGLEPGPSFGPILEDCFEAQLDGEFDDETNGLSYLDSLLEQKN